MPAAPVHPAPPRQQPLAQNNPRSRPRKPPLQLSPDSCRPTSWHRRGIFQPPRSPAQPPPSTTVAVARVHFARLPRQPLPAPPSTSTLVPAAHAQLARMRHLPPVRPPTSSTWAVVTCQTPDRHYCTTTGPATHLHHHRGSRRPLAPPRQLPSTQASTKPPLKPSAVQPTPQQQLLLVQSPTKSTVAAAARGRPRISTAAPVAAHCMSTTTTETTDRTYRDIQRPTSKQRKWQGKHDH